MNMKALIEKKVIIKKCDEPKPGVPITDMTTLSSRTTIIQLLGIPIYSKEELFSGQKT